MQQWITAQLGILKVGMLTEPKQLNKRLKKFNIHKPRQIEIKQQRRTLKNRGYPSKCRVRWPTVWQKLLFPRKSKQWLGPVGLVGLTSIRHLFNPMPTLNMDKENTNTKTGQPSNQTKCRCACTTDGSSSFLDVTTNLSPTPSNSNGGVKGR